MTDKKRVDAPSGTDFVGHEWDGIEELNTPLPRWWLWTFIATIIWALGYTILYPAWPMISSATRGTLGWTSRGELSAALKAAEAQRVPVLRAINATPVTQLTSNRRLYDQAVEGGRAAFKVYCVQCHGSGAAGSKGYPNLNDDDWLWGGDMAAIHYTLEHGIRNPDHEATRFSEMPAYNDMFQAGELQDVISYVRSLSGAEKAGASATRGAAIFAANCVQCHGANGKGVREMGGPNLTDSIWLYGGDRATIEQTIRYSRKGVMPRWNDKLDPVTIKMLTAYVHALGGGEAAPAPEPAKVSSDGQL
jgi:cytochrome c oxidase cbb3-type subunit 3